MTDETRNRLFWSLLVAAVVHAVLLAALFCVGSQFRKQSKPADCDNCYPNCPVDCSPIRPRPYGDAISASPQPLQSPPEVNYAAQGELKQQSPCANGNCPPTYRPIADTYRNPFNLAPGERIVNVSPPRPVVPVQPAPAPTPSPAIYPSYTTPAATQPPSKAFQLLIFDDGSYRSRQLIDWMRANPELNAMRERCEVQIYKPQDRLYQARFASVVPPDQFPAVILQDAQGGHIHAAGKSMLPSTASELVSDFKTGYELYKQAKQGTMQATGAIREAGYSWDEQILPTMRLQDCGPDGCNVPTSDPWRPGSRVVDRLFDNAKDNAAEAIFWGNWQDLATVAVFVLALIVLVFVLARRG